MSRRQIGIFAAEEKVLAATRAAREAGLEVEDVYTPYPVHGIEDAMGLARSRLPFACLVGAALGGLLALWFQHWSSAVSWPVDVGGKPFSSLPAFVPITFELTVLGGALGAVAALLLRRGLRPGRGAALPDPRVTDDRFALVVRPKDSRLSTAGVGALLEAHGAEEVREWKPEVPPMPVRPRGRRLNLALATAVGVLLVLHLSLRPDPSERGVDVLPGMVDSVPADSFAANAAFAGGPTLRSPPEGTISRGLPPERMVPTKEDAARAAATLANPFTPDDAAALARGRKVFATYCAPCHGAGGLGDGTVAKRGFPPPPSLLAENARAMKDGQVYHVITAGQVNMPAYGDLVDRADRWKAVLYVRSLQAAAKPEAPAPTEEEQRK